KGSSFESYVQKKGWEYYALPFKNSLDFYTAWALKKICKQSNIELMHLHTSKSHGIAVLSGALGIPTALLLCSRVDLPHKHNWLSKWKYNYSKIKKIICVSDKIKEIVKEGIEDKAKAVTIHSGIDLEKFNPGLQTNY